jgi:hypothetical protein
MVCEEFIESVVVSLTRGQKSVIEALQNLFELLRQQSLPGTRRCIKRQKNSAGATAMNHTFGHLAQSSGFGNPPAIGHSFNCCLFVVLRGFRTTT